MKLKNYLKLKGIRQGEFARQMGVIGQTVTFWCSSNPKYRIVPSVRNIAKIMDLTDGAVTAVDFFDGFADLDKTPRPRKVHIMATGGGITTACGRDPEGLELTNDRSKVTCAMCRRSMED